MRVSEESRLSRLGMKKSFNDVYAQHLLERGRPAGIEGWVALPVSGGDKHAKEKTFRLMNELGFDRVDASTKRQHPKSNRLLATPHQAHGNFLWISRSITMIFDQSPAF